MDFDDYDSYAPIAPEPPASPAPPAARARLWVPAGVVVALAAVALAVVPATPRHDTATVAADVTLTAPIPTTTTTAPKGIPAGDDTTVTRVIDGDTIEVTGGTRIRFIGIDTPEAAPVRGCFGAEAAKETQRMLPLNQPVRLVYDVGRLDSFGRTLAYVYSLPDGRFVNLALARDGFAVQATFPPNVAHVEDLTAAVTDARTAGRGLWAACPAPAATSTTAPLAPRGAVGSVPVTTVTTARTAYYASCAAARAAGAAPLRRGAAGYRSALDRDGDGVACE